MRTLHARFAAVVARSRAFFCHDRSSVASTAARPLKLGSSVESDASLHGRAVAYTFVLFFRWTKQARRSDGAPALETKSCDIEILHVARRLRGAAGRFVHRPRPPRAPAEESYGSCGESPGCRASSDDGPRFYTQRVTILRPDELEHLCDAGDTLHKNFFAAGAPPMRSTSRVINQIHPKETDAGARALPFGFRPPNQITR